MTFFLEPPSYTQRKSIIFEIIEIGIYTSSVTKCYGNPFAAILIQRVHNLILAR